MRRCIAAPRPARSSLSQPASAPSPCPSRPQVLAASPSADAAEALARAHIKGEAYLEAAEAALKAITLDPGMAKAYLRRG